MAIPFVPSLVVCTVLLLVTVIVLSVLLGICVNKPITTKIEPVSISPNQFSFNTWNPSKNKNSVVLCIGDSTTMGYDSTLQTPVDYTKTAYPKYLADIMNQATSASRDGFLGSGNTATLNQQITLGTGWTIDNTGITTINKDVFSAGINSAALTFQSLAAADSAVIYYVSGPSYGILQANINNEKNQTIDTTNDVITLKSLIIKSSAAPINNATVYVSNISSSLPIKLLGIVFANTITPVINFINSGWSGSTSADWINPTQFAVTSFLPAISADLIIINLGINDMNNKVDIASYQQNMQTLITSALKTSADVILVIPSPIDVDSVTQDIQNQFSNVIALLAQNNKCNLIDLRTELNDWKSGNAISWYADNLHPSVQGYKAIASRIYNNIRVVSKT